MPVTAATSRVAPQGAPTCVELFSGAGGMALGLEHAGFRHLALIERDERACLTLGLNREAAAWPLLKTDVAKVDWSPYAGRVDLLAAGAPCQPFSGAGARRGADDDRNMFPEVLRAARELQPSAVLIENVVGLTRGSFSPYLAYVLDQLRLPELEVRKGEAWPDHHQRLRWHLARRGETYNVLTRLVQAADYGVPQRRQRLLILALDPDGPEWQWPEATHTRDRLLYEQRCRKTYWDEYGIEPREIPVRAPRRYSLAVALTTARWQTVRDAIKDMPRPVDGAEADGWTHHIGVPGARLYKGHTGNPLDWPGKTLKAGVHGVAGGEGVVLLDDGTHRYLTLRECARLQTFDDEWEFEGPRSSIVRQIGNAVPVRLAQVFGGPLRERLSSSIQSAVA